MKGIVDLGRGFVEAINWVIDAIGSLGLALGTIPALMAALQIEPIRLKFESLYTSINNYAGGVK